MAEDWFDQQAGEVPDLAQFFGLPNGNTGIVGPDTSAPQQQQPITAGMSADQWHNQGPREQFRDAFQATGTDVGRQNQLLQQYGLQADQAGRVVMPDGEVMDLRIGAKSGLNQAAWTAVAGGPTFQGGGGGGGGGGYGGGGGGGGTGNLGNVDQLPYYNAPAPFAYGGPGVPTPEKVGYTPFDQQPPNFQSQSWNPYQQAAPYQPGQIQQPGAVNAQQIQGPAALNALQNQTPAGFENLTAQELASDPSFQFRLQQGQDVLENSAAARGTLRTSNTLKALQDYGQQAASQEYAAANQRKLAAYQTNVSNALNTTQANQGNLAQAYGLTNQYQQNAQTQNAQNALQAGQFNAGMNYNTQLANQANQAQAYGMNAQTGLAANQQNNQGQMAAMAANNANAQQGYQNQFAANQANNQGQSNATQANNAAALAAQQAGYGQASNTYNTNAANALGAWQGNTQYNLGLGNLALGNLQAQNSYSLGQGNLGLQQGQLALQQQGQAYNQAANTYGMNYQANVTDPWRMQMDLANLGNYGAPNTVNYGNQVSDLYTQQGNANAAGQIGSANAWTNAAGNIGDIWSGFGAQQQQPKQPGPWAGGYQY